MTPEKKRELLLATHEAAAAFAEDIPHIRQVINRQDTDRGDIRRLSNVIRRLLVDGGGDLRDIATPRIGRFTLSSPDNSWVFKQERNVPFPFYQSGGATVFGIFLRAPMFDNNNRNTQGLNPENVVALPLDNFLSQKVMCLKGKWASRRDVIKYMANIASGVHSGTAKEDSHLMLNRMRRVATYAAIPVPDHLEHVPGQLMPSIKFNVDAFDDSDLPMTYDAGHIDPVLVELMAAANYLVQSPDVIKLEAEVAKELAESQ